MLTLVAVVVRFFDTLTNEEREKVLIFDDSTYDRSRSKVVGLPAEQLDIQLNTSVDEISMGNNGVVLESGKRKFRANQVILATPAPISKAMYKAANTLEADLLETKYSSTVTIAIALNDKLPEKNGRWAVWPMDPAQ